MPLDNITELKRRVPGGKYALTRAVAERARQLQGGATPLVEVKAPNPLSVAIDEIVQGKVTFVMGDPDAAPEVEAAPAKPKRVRKSAKSQAVEGDTMGQPAAPATADSAIGMGTGADKIAAASDLVETGDNAIEINADGAAHEPTTSDATPNDAMRPDVASPGTESVGETSQADTKTSTDTK